MSVFRIYPSKSNTIANGLYQNYNSGQNATSDLWYGGGEISSIQNSVSRLLMYFDLSDLQSKFANGEIMSGSVSSCVLNLQNVIPGDAVLTTDISSDRLTKRIATSFDLVAFPVNKYWDNGIGHDLSKQNYIVTQQGNPLTTGYSNWNSATSMTNWDEPGVFSNPATATTINLPICHFDLGSENLSMDITQLVNYWLVSGNTNYGIGIAYRNDYEQVSGTTRYISSFLTEKTNSAFKPFLQVNYSQTIRDDRSQVSNNRVSRLFLYTYSGNNNVNYYSASTVTIRTGSPTGPVFASGITPSQLSTGVYYFDILMSGSTGQKFFDIWEGVTFNPGIDQQNFTQSFVLKNNYYTATPPKPNDYTINTYGLENNQIITTDEKIRVYVIVRVDYSQNTVSPTFSMDYNIVMNEQIEMVPYTPVQMTIIDNCPRFYFDVDTSWLLTNQSYKINFRIKDGGTKILPQSIEFNVVKPF